MTGTLSGNGPTSNSQVRRLLRRLALRIGVAGAVGLGITVLATMVGFELDVPFFALLAVLIAVTSFAASLVQPADQPYFADLALDAPQRTGQVTDRRVIKLEERLYGADPKRAISTMEVRRVLVGIVEKRLRRHHRTLAQELAQPQVLSAALAGALVADPPQPMSRTRLRTMIKEIAEL